MKFYILFSRKNKKNTCISKFCLLKFLPVCKLCKTFKTEAITGFRTLNTILFWSKVCFLCSSLKIFHGLQTLETLIRQTLKSILIWVRMAFKCHFIRNFGIRNFGALTVIPTKSSCSKVNISVVPMISYNRSLLISRFCLLCPMI